MIREFGDLYGDNPDAMLALMLVMSRYEVVQGGQWMRDWSVDHGAGQIAINSTNLTPFTERSDRNAAKQMYQILADEFYEVSNLPETWGGAFRRRGGGTLQMVGGGAAVVGGGVLIATPEPTMLTKVGGYGAIVVGGNEFVDGAARTFGGRGSSFNVLDMTARSYGNWVGGDVGADQASFYMGITRTAFGTAGALGNSKLANMPARQLPAAVKAQLETMASKFASPGVNLASEARVRHILYGDVTGGGHKFSFSRLFNGKSKFPVTWGKDKILNAVSEVATNPNSNWVQQTGAPGSFFTRAGDLVKFRIEGVYQGVTIRVIVQGDDIITAFPIQ
jgi:hypothetical protein